jgi:hypothetical protein
MGAPRQKRRGRAWMEAAEKFIQRVLKLIAALFVFIIAFAIGVAFGGLKGFSGLIVFIVAASVGALGLELLKSVRR